MCSFDILYLYARRYGFTQFVDMVSHNLSALIILRSSLAIEYYFRFTGGGKKYYLFVHCFDFLPYDDTGLSNVEYFIHINGSFIDLLSKIKI